MSGLVRCYVPASSSSLTALAAGHPLPAGTPAVAVTPAFLAATGFSRAPSDDEEAEYAATLVAAQRSLRLLDPDDPHDRRRVVLAADARVSDDSTLSPGDVRLAGPLPPAQVAAIHVDTASAEPLVDAAVRALAMGGDDADEAADLLAAEDLAWYAPHELDQLL